MPRLVHHKIGKLAPIVIDDSPERELREGSQTEAFKALRDKQLTILNAPTGWGKSLVTLFILAWKLIKNPKLRCVIVVPQTVISKGFLEDIRFKVRGQWVNWSVGHNLCHVHADKRVKALGRFLRRRRQETLSDRVLVCTHQTLAAAYNELPSHVFKNLVLWIDEAHHVMNGDVEDGSVRRNTMGKVLSQCIENGCDIGLATATLMRGDLRQILSEESEQDFVAHKVPYDVYFKESPPVESFSIDLLCGDKEKSLRSILKTKQKTIIYLPKRRSHFASCKLKERNVIFKILAHGGKIKKGLIITQCGTQRVIDLIDTKGRKARQQHIMNSNDVDVIIALETCKEGFDWPAAERSIMIGERKSIPELVQMVGRLFRRAPDKTHASIYQVMPGVKSGDKFKDQRNRIWTSIFAAMLLEDVLIPLKFCKPLAETVSNSAAAQSLWRDFLVAIKGLTYEQSLDRMATVLKGRVPKADWKARWKGLWEQLWKLIYSVRGLHIDVSFEVLKNMDVIDELLLISSDLCGVKTFEELRDAIGRGRKTDSEFETLLMKLTEGSKILARKTELDAQYGRSFYAWCRRNQHRFSEINFCSVGPYRTSKDYEALLMEITKDGTPLAGKTELSAQHGFGFYRWCFKNKHRFPTIIDGSKNAHHRTAKEHENLLLELTKGGKSLPCHTELKAEHGGGFIHWLGANRHRFPKVTQENFNLQHKKATEHEALFLELTKGGKPLLRAGKLIDKYGGGFYSWCWRNQNRFPGTIQMECHKTYFRRKNKKPNHYEALFLELTKGGKPMPPWKELRTKHGCGLENWWRHNKHKFPEVEQARSIPNHKTDKEYEYLFLDITKDGKPLDNQTQLRRKYGRGFYRWCQRNSEVYPKIIPRHFNLVSKIARKHEGLLFKLTKDGKSLPCYSDLKAKYGRGFVTWWYTNKHKFPGIRQETSYTVRRTPQEHEDLFLEITKDGATLGTKTELTHRYGEGFYRWTLSNKHSFPHIKQAKRNK